MLVYPSCPLKNGIFIPYLPHERYALRLESRDNAAELRAELTTRAEALRTKLRDMDLDRLGARRLLRAFPRMQSLRYGETLAATRSALNHLRRLAQSARQAASSAADKLRKPEE